MLQVSPSNVATRSGLTRYPTFRPVGEGWDSGRSKRPRDEVNPEFRCDLCVAMPRHWPMLNIFFSLPCLLRHQLSVGFRRQGTRAGPVVQLTGGTSAISYTTTGLADPDHQEAKDIAHFSYHHSCIAIQRICICSGQSHSRVCSNPPVTMHRPTISPCEEQRECSRPAGNHLLAQEPSTPFEESCPQRCREEDVKTLL